MAAHNIDEIIIAIPSASGNQIKRILSFCDQTTAKVQIVPGIYEILEGKVDLGKLREVQLEDLLRREPVRSIRTCARSPVGQDGVDHRRGWFHRFELARQVARFRPKTLVLFDISENNLYQIQHDLKDEYFQLDLHTVVGSIRDWHKLEAVFSRFRPDVVYHAAPTNTCPHGRPSGGSGEEQCLWHLQRGAGGDRVWCKTLCHDLHRQGHQPHQCHGSHQTHRGDDRPSG